MRSAPVPVGTRPGELRAHDRVWADDKLIGDPDKSRKAAGLVMLKPAQDGTGVIAGGPVRAVVQACGIPNVLTKSIGSHNPHNVVKATFDALVQLRDRGEVAAARGKQPQELY